MGPLMDSKASHSLPHQVSAFIRSMEIIQLLCSDCVMLREYTLQSLLKETSHAINPLIINASDDLSTENLLANFRDHWKLLIPVSTTGFRFQLEDLLNSYRKKVKKGILIVTNANQLPIATQAALMHLLYLQEKKEAVLKIILLGDSTTDKKLKIFRPEGVSEVCLTKIDPEFTQWVVKKIVKESYASCDPVPADIIDLAHNFSKGEPDEMRWIVDKWYSAVEKEKGENTREPLNPHPAVSKIRHIFWNQRAVLPVLMVFALVVGGVTHRFPLNKTDDRLFASWHPVQAEKYSIQLLDTTDRLKALHWVAYHPGLSQERVTSDKNASGEAHYHVEFGKFANRKEAESVLEKLKASDAHIKPMA